MCGNAVCRLCIACAATSSKTRTSIQSEVYRSLPTLERGRRPNGAWLLFSYLNYAETLATQYAAESDRTVDSTEPECRVHPTEAPSELATAVGRTLATEHRIASEVHWGNDGFSVDLSVAAPSGALGVLCDATRFDKAPDRIQWDIFRSEILEAQGWHFLRLWSPQLVRDPARAIAAIATRSAAAAD